MNRKTVQKNYLPNALAPFSGDLNVQITLCSFSLTSYLSHTKGTKLENILGCFNRNIDGDFVTDIGGIFPHVKISTLNSSCRVRATGFF